MNNLVPPAAPKPFDPEKLWVGIQRQLESKVSHHKFSRYVSSIRTVPKNNLFDGNLHLIFPSTLVANWFETNLLDQVEQLVHEDIYPGKVMLEVSNQPDLFETPLTPPANKLSSPAKTKLATKVPANVTKNVNFHSQNKTGLSKKYTFENYYSGPSNEIAIAAGLKLAVEPKAAQTTSPLYINGSVGLGKSHLAHAIGNKFMEKRPSANVRLLSGEHYVREVQNAFVNNKVQEFIEKFRKLDLLIIDDIQMIGKDSEQTNKQFINLFNYMYDRELPIVITSDRPIKRLTSNMFPRLVSRIAMGVDVVVGVPDQDTRVGILCFQAKELFDVELEKETARLIASQLRNNCRELVGALKRIFLQAEYTKAKISTALVKNVLGEITSTPAEIKVHDIIEQTAIHYKVKSADLLSKRRSAAIVLPRHVAMYLARELTQISLPSIGTTFGCHHSSVIHACQKVTTGMHKNKDLKLDVTQIRQELAN